MKKKEVDGYCVKTGKVILVVKMISLKQKSV